MIQKKKEMVNNYHPSMFTNNRDDLSSLCKNDKIRVFVSQKQDSVKRDTVETLVAADPGNQSLEVREKQILELEKMGEKIEKNGTC